MPRRLFQREVIKSQCLIWDLSVVYVWFHQCCCFKPMIPTNTLLLFCRWLMSDSSWPHAPQHSHVSLSFTVSWSLLKFTSIALVMLSNHLSVSKGCLSRASHFLDSCHDTHRKWWYLYICLGQKEETVWTWGDGPGNSFPLLTPGHEPNVLTHNPPCICGTSV